MSAELVRVAGLHKMPSLLFFPRCDNHLHPFPSQDVLGYCRCVHGGEGKTSALRGRAAQRCVLLAAQTPCGVRPHGAIHPHPGPLNLGTTGTLPKHPLAQPWSSQLWKMLEVWGKCGLMLFCHQGARSHALAGTEGGWYMHAWAKIERKEQVSYFTEALEKRLLLL